MNEIVFSLPSPCTIHIFYIASHIKTPFMRKYCSPPCSLSKEITCTLTPDFAMLRPCCKTTGQLDVSSLAIFLFHRVIIMIKKDFATVLALNGFRICGNVSHAALTRIISISRTKRLLKEHIIEKVSYQDKHISKDRNQTTYRLTAHGKDVTRNFLGKGNFQSGRGNERHNTALAEAYSQLTKDEQYTCMNELDLKEYLDQQYYTLLATDRLSEAEELYENMKHMSLIDLTYYKANTQALCCIEVITKNYSTETINRKEFTATEIVHATYNEINIY